MSIDADMRAGVIDMEEAQRRRERISQESQMYGAMDGAMKFVKGDSIAGMIIAVVNIVGGTIIGITQNGMTAGENGLIGRAAGFDVYRSNQVPNVAGVKHKVIAGHRSAWSRAQQLLETEAYRPERRFADALKGLHVYGAKVVRPDNLACLVASDT